MGSSMQLLWIFQLKSDQRVKKKKNNFPEKSYQNNIHDWEKNVDSEQRIFLFSTNSVFYWCFKKLQHL